MSDYAQNKANLEKVRATDSAVLQKNKKIKQPVTIQNAENKGAKEEISPGKFSKISIESDWPYMIALLIALLDDLLDILQFTVVPPIPLLFSIFIGMMLLLGGMLDNGKISGSSKAKTARRQIKIAMKKAARLLEKILSWILGTAVEMVPVIATLPMETLVVIVVYSMTLSDRLPQKEDDE